MSNPTIGFIGYGNMAQAIAEGLVNAGTISGNDIVACAAHYDKLECNAAKLGVKAVHTAAQVAEAADVVVIAIKPYQIEAVISPIVDKLAQPNTIVVSIAAGWDLNKFRDLFGTSFEQAHINAPFRTRRWLSAKACWSRKSTTRSRRNRRKPSKACFRQSA